MAPKLRSQSALLKDIAPLVNLDFVNTTKRVIRDTVKFQVMGQLPPPFAAFGLALKNAVGNRRSLQTTNLQLARGARRSVLQAYSKRVQASPTKVKYGSYREGEDRLPNALGKALRREDMFIGTGEGILFGNRAVLDSQAAHWYRLNYGAGARARSGPFIARKHSIKLFGQRIQQTREGDVPPSAPFEIPSGFWFTSGVTKRGFYPKGPPSKGFAGQLTADGKRVRVKEQDLESLGISRQRRMLTAGIAGRNFFDAGIARIARDIGPAYEDLWNQWVDDAVRNARGAVHKTIGQALGGLFGSP